MIILKLISKGKGTRMAKIILKNKNEMGGISLPVFLTYYILTVIKTASVLQRGGLTEHWDRVGSPEIYAHIYAQLSFTKM